LPNKGELTAGLAGAALLVSLFLPWFGPDPAASGWEALSVLDLVLAAVAVGAVSLPMLRATQRKTDLPIIVTSLVALVAIVASVMVLYRLADPAGDGREIGLYLGLAAVFGVSAGAWAAMRNEGT
jgi:uncharacterized membrane protein